ncbi:MAG: hypothetical protein NWF05_05085 [Candidatus Bathyarchaeota archaeon]|nr:hypothetical protein [Candidatus Bathyarchaeota archaeon]
MKKLLILTAWIIIIATAIVVASVFLDVFRIPFFYVTFLGATHSAVHWIGWAGTLYIAFVTPVYPIVKRRFPRHLKSTLALHIVGNLLAVLLVSIHFAHQVTRPSGFYPDLGTGIVLYAAMILLVATGLSTYSIGATKHAKLLRFLHASFALTFYTVIIVHILQGIYLI